MDINKRSVELRSEAKGILENKQKALDIINKCDMRLLEIQGGLKELDNMVKANAAKLQKPKDIEIIETDEAKILEEIGEEVTEKVKEEHPETPKK